MAGVCIQSSLRNCGGRKGSRRLRASAVQEMTESGMNAQGRPKKSSKYAFSKGTPVPLGPSRMNARSSQGVNFAVAAPNATEMYLCLYEANAPPHAQPEAEVPMEKEGDTWHVALPSLPLNGIEYGIKVNGSGGWETGNRWTPEKVLLDPYSPLVTGRRTFGARDDHDGFLPGDGSIFRGTFDLSAKPFSWGRNYTRPNRHWDELVIYEMGVRNFTADPSSKLSEGLRGSYLGVVEKIPHLVEMGVTAVELLPTFEYDELEFQRRPNPREHLTNAWGYSHINFFSPMSRFVSNSGGAGSASTEFKQMVKKLHEAKIEVILDVVYNHTAEGGDDDPYVLSFRGIDNSVYYMLNTKEYVQMLNYSGCGNTVNANHPIVRKLIIDSLRHWVEEYHVDGFRFDLASALARDGDGTPIPAPPLIREISKDPVLSKCKLIAEPWDCGGLYLVGKWPNWDIWGEWNGKFRDDVRSFIKGDGYGAAKRTATRMAGSADLYHINNRRPYHSINFVIAHDGFTLRDLVSYNEKHNDANGENGNDGSNDNLSWNCGTEGVTDNADINSLRLRQMKNFHVALLCAQGTPMIVMGDEYGHSRYGNNNVYGQDNSLNHFLWDQLDKSREDFFRFYKGMIHFRRANALLGQSSFLTEDDVTWQQDHWDNDESKFLGYTLHDRGSGHDLYIAFNSHDFSLTLNLPKPPAGKKWKRIVDTALPSPEDFCSNGAEGVENVYSLRPYSALLLRSS